MPSLVSLCDHAVLQPTQTAADVREACKFCAELGAASVCVKTSHVKVAAEALAGSNTVASTVIGFPHGGTSTQAKVAETHQACADGAREVDMVVNLGALFGGEWEVVEADIAAVVAAAKSHSVITKVIFESGLLTSGDQKRKLCEISERAGAAFVKTSTGFGYVKNAEGQMVATGATLDDVKLMRATCSKNVQVKASGGIRSFADAQAMVAAGATRLGTSGTQAIAAGERGETAVSKSGY